MSAVRSRAKRLESTIGFCLLAILVLIAVGVFLRQFDTDMSRFGIDKTAAELLAREKEEKTPLGLLTPSEFEPFSGIQTYTAENLYEKINGKADFYLDSGFKVLSTRRFISKDDDSLFFELYVYDMTTTRNAFSVYSTQRRPQVHGLPDMQFGYKTSNALYFAHGKYYIELVGSSESTQLSRAIVETAQKIQANLVIDKPDIPELAFFPQENLVPGSIKLYLTDAFGFEGLTDTFAAGYRFADQIITAFLTRRSSPEDATRLFHEYHKFLLSNGGKDIPTTNPQARSVDFYGTLEILFVTGPFVAGVHEAENRELAGKVVETLLNKLIQVTDSANDERPE